MSFYIRTVKVYTASKQVNFAYRCRNCGKIVSVNHMFSVSTGNASAARAALIKKLPEHLRRINDNHLFPEGHYVCRVCGTRTPKGMPTVTAPLASTFIAFSFSAFVVELLPKIAVYLLPALYILPWIIWALIRKSRKNASAVYAFDHNDEYYNPLAATREQLDPDSDDPRMQALILSYVKYDNDDTALSKKARELRSSDEFSYMDIGKPTQAAATDTEKAETEYKRAIALRDKARKEENIAALERAAQWFDEMAYFRDSAEIADACREEIVEIKRKKAIRKAIFKYIALIILAALLVYGGITLYHKVIYPKVQLKKADEYAQAGEYANALEIYEIQGETQKVQEMNRKLGDSAYTSGDLDAALSYYRTGNDSNGIQKTREKMGDNALAQGDMAGAEENYRQAGRNDKINSMYLTRFEQLAAQGDLKRAFETYQNCSNTADADTMLQLILTQKESVDSRVADEIAAAYGSAITDLDAQLAYCEQLYNAGYNLEFVYPDGVEVDVVLNQYSACNKTREITAGELGFRFLIFSMKEKTPSAVCSFSEFKTAKREYHAFTDYSTNDRTLPETYTVRLLPGMLYLLPKDERALSWNDCTELIIAEDIYMGESFHYDYPSTPLNNSYAQQLAQMDLDEIMASDDSKFKGFTFRLQYSAINLISVSIKDKIGTQSWMYSKAHEPNVELGFNGTFDDGAMMQELIDILTEL